MGFKFLGNNSEEIPDEDYHQHFEEVEQLNEDERHISSSDIDYDNNAIVTRYINTNNLSERSWLIYMVAERSKLMRLLYNKGMVLHQTISEDENGKTIRTELIYI
jgi:hypothetical protein